MYLPAATVAANMATETTEGRALKLNPEVTSSTASSIYIKWAWEGVGPVYVRGFRVHYHSVASTYVQQSRMLPPSADSYGITNLVADTYYKVCVTMLRNDTSFPLTECVDAATTSWHIPVSIGSSIGAVLALSIIVLIVLLSRCPNLVRQPRTAAAESSKYDSMSSHFPDDRYEMSDTTTHYHDHERDDDVFSQNSDGDSLAETKGVCRHNHHYSPQSLADRLCNGNRLTNGIGKHSRAPIPLGRCGRTLSLTDKRHPPSHRTRQARLAHLHANFHSIQSEPGTIPLRAAPRVSITDFPASSNSADISTPRKTPHHSSLPSTSITSGKGFGAAGSGFTTKLKSQKDNPRTMYRIESATSSSEPIVSEIGGSEPKAKPPVLKNISKTLHMSIDSDTLV